MSHILIFLKSMRNIATCRQVQEYSIIVIKRNRRNSLVHCWASADVAFVVSSVGLVLLLASSGFLYLCLILIETKHSLKILIVQWQRESLNAWNLILKGESTDTSFYGSQISQSPGDLLPFSRRCLQLTKRASISVPFPHQDLKTIRKKEGRKIRRSRAQEE